ncbi:MAG: DNA gyrase subunit A [Bacteroidota bacterium]
MEEIKETKSQIIPVSLEAEMLKSYINYAIYVITHRALPNVYDGLKPVQRRILVAFHQMGLTHNKAYKKTVTTVGETMGKYHPHGDNPIYQALVRLAQKWVMRYPLVDGQGNFGSVDGDEPAAMRYTEGRTKRIAEDGLLADLSKDVVPFQPNFDSSLEEPLVLPASLPNLLVNGCAGIAVGMATNMPPHNLREVIDGIQAYIDNNEITIEELMAYIKAPDFPTGGIIYGHQGISKAFETGKGRIVVRGVAEIETAANGRESIVVTELPYMVNKASMIEKTAILVGNKVIEGISDIRDESDKSGIRVVYEIKRDARANVVLNNLFKHTALQSSFNVNNVALVDGAPKLLNLKELIKHYVTHRHTIVTARTEAAHKEAQQQLHILDGYLMVIKKLDTIITLLRGAKDPKAAQAALMEEHGLSEVQAKKILSMQLQRLTGLESEKTINQHRATKALIEKLAGILEDRTKRMDIIKEELKVLRARYGDDRRTAIEHDETDLSIEDMIPNERMVITLSKQGYIKSSLLSAYKLQQRGGVGAKGVSMKKEDDVSHLFTASAHDYLLIFTEYGRIYTKRVYELPQGNKATQGRAIQNLLQIQTGDKVRSILPISNLDDPDYVQKHYVTICTTLGRVKKMNLSHFAKLQKKGKIAIKVNDNDRLLDACLTGEEDYIILAARSGKVVRFPHTEVRPMGCGAAGVRGIKLDLKPESNEVVSLLSVPVDEQVQEEGASTLQKLVQKPKKNKVALLAVSEKSKMKRSFVEQYSITRRGAKGVKTMNLNNKTGLLFAVRVVNDKDELMIIKESGRTARIKVKNIPVSGRRTQGVYGLDPKKLATDKIASLAVIPQLN